MVAEYGIGFESPVGCTTAFLAKEVPGGIKWLIIFWLIFMLAALWYGRTRGWWQGHEAISSCSSWFEKGRK